jgi:ubiquinone/menaquinone biosynthesis C-methylase UbiE
VLEVGAGAGLNFAYYPPSVTEVVAVEPEVHLRAQAVQKAATAPVPIRVVAGSADHLPLGDASVDAAVTSLVLCSVPDQHLALAELFRVVRPGGELRFYEHVRAPTPALVLAQRAIEPLWSRLGGGLLWRGERCVHVGTALRARTSRPCVWSVGQAATSSPTWPGPTR